MTKKQLKSPSIADNNQAETGPGTDNLPAVVDRKIDVSKAIKMRFIQGMTYQAIADVFDCHKSSVYDALKPFKDLIQNDGVAKGFRENHVQILEGLLLGIAGNIADPTKQQKANLYHLTYTYDKIFNALRLLKGESTANVEHAHHMHKDLQEIEAEIAAIEGSASCGEIDNAAYGHNAATATGAAGLDRDMDTLDAEIERLEVDNGK